MIRFESKNGNEIPEVVILRLPLYMRVLAQLQEEHVEVVSSKDLGQRLKVTPAQIRKDLSYFGRFGKQGRGYNVAYLHKELMSVLGLDRTWNTAVIGIGRLGRAIISYPGFRPQGFNVVAAFDSDPRQVGTTVADLTVRDTKELEESLKALDIEIAIVAVPSVRSQQVVDRLVAYGIKAILNYAPTQTHVPSDVKVRNIDPVLALQTLTYHLKSLAMRKGDQSSERVD